MGPGGTEESPGGSGGRFDRDRTRGWAEGRILGCRLSCEDDPGGEIGVVAVDAKSGVGLTLPVAHEVMGVSLAN